MELTERTLPALPRPDPLNLKDVKLHPVIEGELSPTTGFVLTIPEFIVVLENYGEIRRWIAEASARLEEYENRTERSEHVANK